MKMRGKITVFRDVILCSLVEMYQRVGGACYPKLRIQEWIFTFNRGLKTIWFSRLIKQLNLAAKSKILEKILKKDMECEDFFCTAKYTQCGPKVPGLNFLPLSYQRHLPGRDWTTQLKPFLTRVQIGASVVAVVVKTERLALTFVVTLCQCREIDVKGEQHGANKFCCKVDFSATKTMELIQKAYGESNNNFWVAQTVSRG